MTKSLKCKAVVSEEVRRTAGLAADALKRTDVEVRDRDEPITVRTAEDPAVLASLLGVGAGHLHRLGF
jgi:adenylate cyclase